MEPYWYWLITGFILIIAEMLTGTFYLVVLGLAAFAGALAAYLGLPLTVQAATATALAALGVVIVSRYRRSSAAPAGGNTMDVGQMVTFVSWVDEAQGLARVKYRDTQWDARVIGARQDHTYYILSVQGSVLHVGATPP